eukprot:TRINITY_DN3591_c0_g1_i1.p1 TRINITY_DN3591_c0_g1~~TRINITY_DN3591_c0_g1_i1.p1  ORF type:complete len:146 (+),score=31.97 TRINITY_DN3591_c0_g1_i1:86-523(+)
MVVYSVYILNKFGSLLYQQDFDKTSQSNNLSNNDHLRLGSTFHGLHTITREFSPLEFVVSGGIQYLETDTFVLECFETPTGIKFFLIGDKQQSGYGKILNLIYELYSDYVMKNPFYQQDQPIRCELFDIEMHNLLNQKSDSKKNH